MNRVRYVASAALLGTLAWKFALEPLPYDVTYVEWTAEAKERQQEEYLKEARAGHPREVLFCVESWKTHPPDKGIELVIIEKIRRAGTGGKTRIHDIGDECVAPNGKPLPTLHTHIDGNCQFSPTDLVTVVARRAVFEGVQCGDRHFIWAFAWQVLAIANTGDRWNTKPRPDSGTASTR